MRWKNKKSLRYIVLGIISIFTIGGVTYEVFQQSPHAQKEHTVSKAKPIQQKRKLAGTDENAGFSSTKEKQEPHSHSPSTNTADQQVQKILSWYDKESSQTPTQPSTVSIFENLDVEELKNVANHMKETTEQSTKEINSSLNSETVKQLATAKPGEANTDVSEIIMPTESLVVHEPTTFIPTTIELTENPEIQSTNAPIIQEVSTLHTLNNSIFLNEGEAFNPFDYVELISNAVSKYNLKVHPYEWHSGENQLTIEADDGNGQPLSTILYVYYNMRPRLFSHLSTNELEIPIHSSIDFKKLVEASDDEDGELSDSIQYETDFDANKVGHYTVVYSVADKQGLQAEQYHLNVTVTNESPKLLLSKSEWFVGEPFDVLKEVSVYDKEDSMKGISIPIKAENILHNNVDMTKAGSYSIAFQDISDSDGNALEENTVQIIVTDEDNEIQPVE